MSLRGLLTDHARTLATLSRFATVGVIATLTHVSVALFVHHTLELGALTANLLAYMTAFTISFRAHRSWTFRVGAEPGQLWRFLALSVASFGLGQALIWLTVIQLGWPFALGQAVIVVAVPLTTFVGARTWAFRAG